jgi:NADH-quinone oxidoreductase subunit M
MANLLLVFLILLPVAAALGLAAIPSSRTHLFRTVAMGVSALQLVLVTALIANYNTHSSNLHLQTRVPWLRIPFGSLGTLQADFFLAVDGLSIGLITLSVAILLIATLASWAVTEKAKGYFILLLILNGSIIGTFAAMDLLLFYLFFEFILLPMYFLIGIWGGPRREYAAIKFFLYTLLGSILILIAIIVLYLSGGTFSIPELIAQPFADSALQLHQSASLLGLSIRAWCFWLLVIGFAIKLPLFPFHTWLPDAHVEASTPISVILAALLLKVGGYGLARVAFPIFPVEAMQFSWALGLVAVFTIVYGALNALAAKDLKRLIAYSSVSHMGFVVLGLASGTIAGIAGSIYQMISHGIISAMLFLLAGVLYDRTHDRQIANYSGLQSVMPHYTALVLVAFFASFGLPGFSGFIAEFLALTGAFQSQAVNQLLPTWMPLVAILGIIITAAFYVWTIQRMFFGTFYCRSEHALPDLSLREKVLLYPLAMATFALGIFPQPLLNWLNPFADSLSQLFVVTP